MQLSTIFTAAGLISLSSAQYTLTEDFFSGNFFDNFDFFTGVDPTAGWVNYVDQTTAQNNQLINTNKGAFIGVDSTSTNVQAPGRDSIRLSSKNAYTYMLVVLDLYNMPVGMGTWPAFWTFGPDWPNNGEIDIIEGVNDQSTNFMTLHLGENCNVTSQGNALLEAASNECDANLDSNAGCSFHDTDSSSFGTGFNQAGGGVYAMEWTSTGVNIWRWIGGVNLPSDALTDTPDPSGWGAPSASWTTSNTDCNIAQDLAQHNIIFDTTFCGSWAGAVYPGGLDACQTYVSNTPSAFTNTYWGVNSLKVYQQSTSNSQNAGSGSSPSSAISAAQASASSVSAAASSPAATSFSTVASSVPAQATSTPVQPAPSAAVSTPAAAATPAVPASPSESASPTSQPLTEGDFGSGSQGIPEGSEGWGRRAAADMQMGERRRARRSHLARHVQAAKH